MTIHLIKYLSIGAFQFALDFLLFVFFQKIGIALILSNTASRLTAATAGYYLNKKFTFSVGDSVDRTMVLRYWFFWAMMTVVSSLLIYAWGKWVGDLLPIGWGKFVVESFLCLLGFVISKTWVYRHAQE